MKQISREIFDHIINGGPEGEVSIIRQLSAKNNRPELVIYKVASGCLSFRVKWKDHAPCFYLTLDDVSRVDHCDLLFFIKEEEATEECRRMLKRWEEKLAVWKRQRKALERHLEENNEKDNSRI